ncbi:hypothetical protein FOZ61_002604 [Perkinsus olseni]|uniref:Uncharacterized protein n=1 Tax=Perkinsus olseni TaxID=32597 RepID=A0A7J6LSR6_PEROL|nr:hypothetical protein FOZ61_002604 [Perkinsus olseni]
MHDHEQSCATTRSNFTPITPSRGSNSPTPTDNPPYTCDAATPAVAGTYRGSFEGSSTQGVSLQFAQPKKIGVMAGSFNSSPFSFSNIYYEFVSGQSWFSLRPFHDSKKLLSLFNLQSMDQGPSTSPGSSSGSSSPTTRTTPTPDNTPYTCDAATPAVVGTYRGSFEGSSTQGVSLQFAQPKKIGVMAGSYDSSSFSYSNIYYEFVSGQSWFSLRPFDDSNELLSLFNLQSMDQVRVYINHQCQPIRIDFGSTASAPLAKEV